MLSLSFGVLQFQQDFEFELAEFPVGQDEEVAAAASWIEEAEFGQLGMKVPEAHQAARGAVSLDAFKFGAEVIEEK